jgi:hypothetical protein
MYRSWFLPAADDEKLDHFRFQMEPILMQSVIRTCLQNLQRIEISFVLALYSDGRTKNKGRGMKSAFISTVVSPPTADSMA